VLLLIEARDLSKDRLDLQRRAAAWNWACPTDIYDLCVSLPVSATQDTMR
jgi:hypothetical protein